MGDSVPQHTGPISLTGYLTLEPSSPEPELTSPPEKTLRWKGLFTRGAQAACRCKFCGSKLTPFFQIVNVIVAIFRARVRRAMVGRIPLAIRAA